MLEIAVPKKLIIIILSSPSKGDNWSGLGSGWWYNGTPHWLLNSQRGQFPFCPHWYFPRHSWNEWFASCVLRTFSWVGLIWIVLFFLPEFDFSRSRSSTTSWSSSCHSGSPELLCRRPERYQRTKDKMRREGDLYFVEFMFNHTQCTYSLWYWQSIAL